jgi:hypothetical protein
VNSGVWCPSRSEITLSGHSAVTAARALDTEVTVLQCSTTRSRRFRTSQMVSVRVFPKGRHPSLPNEARSSRPTLRPHPRSRTFGDRRRAADAANRVTQVPVGDARDREQTTVHGSDPRVPICRDGRRVERAEHTEQRTDRPSTKHALAPTEPGRMPRRGSDGQRGSLGD